VKSILIGLLTLVVVAIGAVLIGPNFVNWNAYKSDFSQIIYTATGRNLNIVGDISITVLPSPALIAKDVHFANIEGASSPDMASLESVEVHIMLRPLLSGNVVVKSVHLIKPVIELEVLADGRSNMTFAPIKTLNVANGRESLGSNSSDNVNGRDLSVRIENLIIDAGTLVFRNRENGQIERIDSIDATISAASLNGPFEITGSMLARGVPFNIDVTVGNIIRGRTVTFAATLESALGRARTRINGTVTNLAKMPRFKGTLSASSVNLAAVAGAMASIGELPGGVSQPFSTNGDIIADAGGVEISNLLFRLGDIKGTAAVSMKSGKETAINAEISINQLDLDKWLSLPPFQPQPLRKATSRLEPTSPPRLEEGPVMKPGSFLIPKNIVGSLDLNIGTINYHGGLIRQVLARAVLSNGEITVSQVAAQLPGSSDVAMFGFISAVAGKPQFDGELKVNTSDLRQILDWLGVDPPPAPLDRLRKMTIKSKLIATPDEIRISGLNMRLDSSRLTGAITVALRNRPAFGAKLTLDRINLDNYMSVDKSANSKIERKHKIGENSPRSASNTEPSTSALQLLDGIDANFEFRIGALTYQKLAILGLALDATLFNGNLDIHDASISDAAGSRIHIMGGVSSLTGIPSLKSLRIKLKAPETGRLFRLFGTEPPIDPRRLGAVEFSSQFDGNLLSPAVDAKLQALETEITIKGNLSAFSADSMIDADITLQHGDLPRLLRMLGIAFRSAGPLDAIKITGHVKAGSSGLNIAGMTARLAQSDIKGDVAVSLSEGRPHIFANLTSGKLAIDQFLPTQRAAMNRGGGQPIDDQPEIISAAWLASPRATRESPIIPAATTSGNRWSREPIKLPILGAFDANITLKSDAITYQSYKLEEANIAASLAGGVLRADKVTGLLFGGNFGGGMEFDSNVIPRLSSSLSLKGASLNAVMATFGAKKTTDGLLNADIKAGSSGYSISELVGTLAGNGSFALLRVDVTTQARGTPLSGVLDLLGSINELSGTMNGGRDGGRADLTGSYVIESGIAHSNDIRLISRHGNGQATGTVNLPEWKINMAGQIDLKKNLLATYLTRNTRKIPTALPFKIQGPLDAPNVQLEFANQKVGGYSIPGVDKLIEKSPAGQLLQQIFPGLPGTQTQQQKAPQQAKPEDLLRGLLNGLMR
jgi:uncharacterized protein involved in outer membrane biogenesis